MQKIEGVTGAGEIEIEARLFRPQAIVGDVIDTAKGQSCPEMIAFGGMVINYVENHFDAGGVQMHSVSTAALDGSAAPIKGGMEADTVALQSPGSNVLIMALSKGGVPGSTRIYTAAPDGKSLVETAVYFGDHGVPIMRTHYFTRVR